MANVDSTALALGSGAAGGLLQAIETAVKTADKTEGKKLAPLAIARLVAECL